MLHDREDNWKKVFHIAYYWKNFYKKYMKIITAKEFIMNNKSATRIVLTGLMKWLKTYSELKMLTRNKSENAVCDALYQLEKMWVNIYKDENWYYNYICRPDNVVITNNRVISWLHNKKENKLEVVSWWFDFTNQNPQRQSLVKIIKKLIQYFLKK
jgi:hypothetical protein